MVSEAPKLIATQKLQISLSCPVICYNHSLWRGAYGFVLLLKGKRDIRKLGGKISAELFLLYHIITSLKCICIYVHLYIQPAVIRCSNQLTKIC